MTLAQKITRILHARGISGRELARQLGDVSATTVNNWISGKTQPEFRQVERIAALTGVSLLYFAAANTSDDISGAAFGAEETIAQFVARLGAPRVSAILIAAADQGMAWPVFSASRPDAAPAPRPAGLPPVKSTGHAAREHATSPRRARKGQG